MTKLCENSTNCTDYYFFSTENCRQAKLANCNYGTCKLLFNLGNSSQIKYGHRASFPNDNLHPRTDTAKKYYDWPHDKATLRRAAWSPSSRTSTTGGSTSSTWSLAASSATTRRESSCPLTGWRRWCFSPGSVTPPRTRSRSQSSSGQALLAEYRSACGTYLKSLTPLLEHGWNQRSRFYKTVFWWPDFAHQIVALVSICFIIISTVVLTLNTLPYFQVTTMFIFHTLIIKMIQF